MPVKQAAFAPRSVPAGALLALSIGLALYQATSLALGPSHERVLHISMVIPQVQASSFTDPVVSDVTLFGNRIVPALSSISPLIGKAAATVMHAAPITVLTSPAALTNYATDLVAPVSVSSVKKHAGRDHYHDADERSPGLARRR